MVERDLRLVEITGARYHAAHVSTAAAIEAIRRAKARGLPVTCDTAPPYFALNETAVGDYRTFAKLSPPLRGEGDRQAVDRGARRRHHRRHRQRSCAAGSGIRSACRSPRRATASSGWRRCCRYRWSCYHNRHLSLVEVLRKLTIAPARILGLGVGRLAAGAPADLVIFDPDAKGRIETDKFRSKSKNAPFDGRPVQGRVERTVVDGRTIFERAA